MQEKQCFKCGGMKSLDQFYPHNMMSDGHLNKCKECTKKDAKETRNAKLEYYKDYDRKRASLPHRIALRRKVAEKWKKDPELKKRNSLLKRCWIEKHREIRQAHIIVGNAIRVGKLKKERCQVCGSLKVDAHHEDYRNPFEIQWLCREHHMEVHRRKREEARKAV